MKDFNSYIQFFDSFITKHLKVIKVIFSLITFVIFSFYFYKNRVSFLQINNLINWDKLSFTFIFYLILCFFATHFLDALLWKKILDYTTNKKISVYKSFVMNWKTLAVSISTPGRIGEIPYRKILLGNEGLSLKNYKSATRFFIIKPITFLYFLLISITYLWLPEYIMYLLPVYLFLILVTIKLVLSLSIFKSIKLILINSLRVFSFCALHFLILQLFCINKLEFINFIHLIFVHSVGAIIPPIFGSDILLKSTLPEIFSFDLPFSIFSFSVLSIWFINIFIPTIIGLFLKHKND